MGLTVSKGFTIKGITSVLPSTIEENLEIDSISNFDAKAFINHTGINKRFVVSDKQEFNSFMQRGISDVLNGLSWNLEEVDVLIVVSQTELNIIPSIACRLHGEMGFNSHTLAYDINLGCSGFVYGLNTVNQILASISKKNPKALLCCGDFSSRLIEANDMTVKPIFSDGISVTAIEWNVDEDCLFNLETFGNGRKAIYTDMTERGNFMRLNGIDVFNYSLKYVPSNIKSLLTFAQLNISNIDRYIFHQANLIINKSIAKNLGVNSRSIESTIQKFGNTGSASIPVTLCQMKEVENLKILLSGFGVGFSVASCILDIKEDFYRNMIFI